MYLEQEYQRSRIIVIPTRWSRLKAFAFLLDFDRYVVVIVVDCIMVVVIVVVVFLNVGRVWAPRYGQCGSVTQAI